jgi:hypothetical protein
LAASWHSGIFSVVLYEQKNCQTFLYCRSSVGTSIGAPNLVALGSRADGTTPPVIIIFWYESVLFVFGTDRAARENFRLRNRYVKETAGADANTKASDAEIIAAGSSDI